MTFTTPVNIPSTTLSLTPHSHAIMLGSCFADEIGSRLADSLPEGNVDVNPFGVLYNPASIALALRLLISEEQAEDVIRPYIFQGHDGMFHSWAHSTHFSDSTFDGCLTRCATRLETARNTLAKADLLAVTLGTDRAYRHDGTIVANCHKEPARMFTEENVVLLPDLCRDDGNTKDDFTIILNKVRALYPALHVIITVSPYRYKKYGFHESQLSKSRLLLLCDTLCKEGLADYFPAYEILLDELRDYRFYAADMLHPSEIAVDYIWEQFRRSTFTQELANYAQQRQKTLRQQRHRPFHQEGDNR